MVGEAWEPGKALPSVLASLRVLAKPTCPSHLVRPFGVAKKGGGNPSPLCAPPDPTPPPPPTLWSFLVFHGQCPVHFPAV